MNKPVKTLPPGYTPAASVTLTRTSDLIPMLIWSLVLPALLVPLIVLALRLSNRAAGSGTFSIQSTGQFAAILGGILLMTVVMVVVHEGLHGLVFWLATADAPKFEFKFYYASASPGGWYLPRRVFMLATLLPLVVISLVCLALIPFAAPYLRYLLILLAVFNASGSAGDLVVALRLARLPAQTLSLDSGSSVTFFAPTPGQE